MMKKRPSIRPKNRQGAARVKALERRFVVIEPGDPEVEIIIPRWDGQRSKGNTVTVQYSNESDAAYRAFCDYCMMGPTRSFAGLSGVYERAGAELDREAKGEAMPEGWKRPAAPATRRLSTLKEWACSFDWARRVRGYDEFFIRDQVRTYKARLATSLSAQLDLIDGAMALAGAAIREELDYFRLTGKTRIPFRDAVRLFDLALRHYRKALGVEPTSVEASLRTITETGGEIALDISNTELEQVLATLADALAFDGERDDEKGHDYDQYSRDRE